MEIISSNSDNTMRKFKRYATMRITSYIVVNAFLTFVNFMTNPNYWWVLWVMGGWGIGLALDLINKWYKLEED